MSRIVRATSYSCCAAGLVILTSMPRAAAGATCAPPPAGVTAWWPGDGTTDDIVGCRDGSLMGTAGFAPGIVGDAFRFDGSGWVDVPDDPIWTLGTRSFTIGLWVRLDALSPGGHDPFIAHDTGYGEVNKWIFWYDRQGSDKLRGTPALRFHINSPHPLPVPYPHDTVAAPWTPVLGRWYFVAVTRSGTSYTLYIDGAQVATDTSTFLIPDPVGSVTIGRAEAFWLNGLVDEVEVLDRALSPAEIRAIFDAGGAGTCKGRPVGIDIRPGRFPNRINPRSKKTIPVAILTTGTFDAADVDPATVRFGATGTEAGAVQWALEDVDGDGDIDMALDFDTQATGIPCGGTAASLTGETGPVPGCPHPLLFRGTDSIVTFGCR